MDNLLRVRLEPRPQEEEQPRESDVCSCGLNAKATFPCAEIAHATAPRVMQRVSMLYNYYNKDNFSLKLSSRGVGDRRQLRLLNFTHLRKCDIDCGS